MHFFSTEFKDDHNIIRPCAKGCKGGCTGPTTQDCKECIRTLVTNNLVSCVEDCPLGYYASENDKSCRRCHSACKNGCSGPYAFKGDGGCFECSSFVAAPKSESHEEFCFVEPKNVESIDRLAAVLDEVIKLLSSFYL